MTYQRAIHELHSNVHTCTGDAPDVVAHDIDGNVVTFDAGAVATKAAEILTADNLHWLRFERNILLAETDYWNASDTPDMSAEQIAYRQALRDITETYTSLDDVVWPTKP